MVRRESVWAWSLVLMACGDSGGPSGLGGSSTGGGSTAGNTSAQGAAGLGGSGGLNGGSGGSGGDVPACNDPLEVVTPPGQVLLDPTLSWQVRLAQTTSGFLHAANTNTLEDVRITAFDAQGAIISSAPLTTHVQNPRLSSLVPACGGTVVLGGGLSTGAGPGFFTVLGDDGVPLVPLKNLPFAVSQGPTSKDGGELIATTSDGVARLDCQGEVLDSVPAGTLLNAIPCPAGTTCFVDRCAVGPGGDVACVLAKAVTLNDHETREWVVVLSPDLDLVAGPNELLPNVTKAAVDLVACGPGCWSLVMGVESGGRVIQIDGSGNTVGSPAQLMTPHGFVQGTVARSHGILALFTPDQALVQTLYPTDLFLFDANTFAPLQPDALGQASPLELPAPAGGCANGAFFAIAPTSLGTFGVDYVSVPQGNEACEERQSLLFLGCP